jgi:hypothetical protein
MTTPLNDCGCCAGIGSLVPEPLFNRPGLSQVSYRIGTHFDFLQSALALLSDPRFPALRSLTTRDTDDFTIALLNGWATLADVLTFYQERIANESWLRTATERDSILRLAQLIGYRLRPGVAAETPLSFLLDQTPGAPAAVTVAIGTKVQSIPGADEKPQTFETIEELDARVEWNALQPALTTPPVIAAGLTNLYLKGAATNLQPGDAILIVGDERANSAVAYPDKERWDMRLLLSVTPDPKNDRTLVTWEKGLGKTPILPAAANPKVYALRQRAALFGHNAPDPTLIPGAPTQDIGGGFQFEIEPIQIQPLSKKLQVQLPPQIILISKDWQGLTTPSGHLDLDNAYAKIVTGSWLSLTNSAGYVELYKCNSVSFPSRAAFALSGKVTRIIPDTTENFDLFRIRDTLVHAQSELLEMTSGPLLAPASGSIASKLSRDSTLLAPIEGSTIALDRLVPSLPVGRKVMITGKLVRARVIATSLMLTAPDGLQTRTISKGATLVVTALPSLLPANQAKWSLRTDEGFDGTVTTSLTNLRLTTAQPEDATVSETAVLQNCAGEPTILTLESPLAHLFDRATVTIAANVAEATHGETVSEVLGNGDASQPNQKFKLRQTPALTYARSTAPGGAESSLQIRVNDLLWHEVPALFERDPRERIFTTEMADDGSVTVRFGDGIRGARLPSGSQNVKATYRRGIGLEGLVRAGQLTTLLTRPPGLKSAINALAAEGADDPESFADAQQNAPLTVLTLDRVVSLTDYENFSRAYSGIAKALATWTWDGRTRGVFITVAGPLGAGISTTLAQDLITAIHNAGDPFVPVRVVSYAEALFRVAAQIKIDPDYETGKVLTAAEEALRDSFSFAKRNFGQPVGLSEVMALLQAVAGVVAVNITALHRTGAAAIVNARLEANLPSGGDPNSLGAAELLTLDPAPLDLEVML